MAIFKSRKKLQPNVWARPEMSVTFRAEIMPGKNREERTFRVKDVLSNNRVRLHGFSGEHQKNEFEALNFLRDNTG